MPELPWFKCYPQDALSDQGVNRCSASARGVWFFAWFTMHLVGDYKLSGTADQLAADCRVSVDVLLGALSELRETKTANIIEQNGNITIICRRLLKEHGIRELKRKAGLASATRRATHGQQVEPTQGATPSVSVSASVLCTGDKRGVGEQGGTVETLPFLPPADDVRIEPNSVARITAAHQQYCRLTNFNIPQRPENERAWLEYLRTHTIEELALVVRYLKSQVKHEKRNEGCLKFSNLVANLSRFEEDLAMANAWARNGRPVPTEREKVLSATGRPPVKPPADKTPGPIVAKLLAELKEAAK